MTLSRREGVDIRPTLLRVLTDLYVQASAHSGDEERQFIELTSRLIDEVDDATRAAVRARLAIYPGTPAEVLQKTRAASPPRRSARAAGPRDSRKPAAAPAGQGAERGGVADGVELVDAAEGRCRNQRHVLPRQLQRTRPDPAQSADTPLRASARIPAARAGAPSRRWRWRRSPPTSRISRSSSAKR